jgi:multiple sugar transport system substrate-binding protein
MTRRFVKVLVTLMTALLMATSALAQPYEDYEGTTIVVSWPALSHFEIAAEFIDEFTAETGIDVELDLTQYLNMKDRQITEISKPGGGDLDVVAWVVFTKNEYVANGWLEPLARFLNNPRLTMPDYDIDDIVPAYLTNGGKSGGRKSYLDGPGASLFGIPFSPETSVLAYRTDIFEEYDLEVPTTYDELLETAAFITENVPDMYGITTRGSAGHQVVHAWLLHLSPLGGTVLDDNYTPVVNSPEAIRATEVLQTILNNAPPGAEANGAGEQDAAFLQGDTAMYLDRMTIAPIAENPDTSTVVGNVGYALHPTDVTCGSETGGFAMGIPSNSRNQEAAWLFIQWFTSKMGDRMVVEAGGNPMRMSTLADPELQAMRPEFPVVLEQLECANADWRPLIPEWPAMNAPILGEEISAALTGQKSIEDALNDANGRLQELLDRAGYNSWE